MNDQRLRGGSVSWRPAFTFAAGRVTATLRSAAYAVVVGLVPERGLTETVPGGRLWLFRHVLFAEPHADRVTGR